MNRRTDDWVLSALGAVILVALIVMVGALVVGLRSSEAVDTTALVEPTATRAGPPTLPPEKQLAVDSDENARASALANPPSPGATKNEIVPTEVPRTPAPTPSGVICKSDDLIADRTDSQGNTGWTTIIFTVANLGASVCDLPTMERVQAFDDGGNLLFEDEIKARRLPGRFRHLLSGRRIVAGLSSRISNT